MTWAYIWRGVIFYIYLFIEWPLFLAAFWLNGRMNASTSRLELSLEILYECATASFSFSFLELRFTLHFYFFYNLTCFREIRSIFLETGFFTFLLFVQAFIAFLLQSWVFDTLEILWSYWNLMWSKVKSSSWAFEMFLVTEYLTIWIGLYFSWYF